MPMQFPSAELGPSPLQNPDFLASYLRGSMAPGMMQEQQNTLAQQGLGLDQLRLALRNQQAYQNVAFQQLQGQGYNVGDNAPSGTAGAGAQSGASSAGGIQTGPQSTVTGPMRTGPTQGYGSFDGSINGFAPSTLGALALLRGDDPLKTAQGVQDYQVKQKQLQAQGPIDTFDSIFSSAAPARTVMTNPQLMAGWMKVAPQLGMDPVKDFNDQNVRAGLAFAANQIRGQAAMPAKDYPVPPHLVNGAFGQQFQVDPVTGKATQISGREMPSYALQDKWDPATGKMIKVPVQTGGWGAGTALGTAAGATGNAASAAATGTAPGIDMGYKAPTDPELKAAMFGSEMRSGMQTMSSMENQGFNLSPGVRAMIINAATSEDEGALRQLGSQEMLVHGMSPQDQTYVAALMPVLQAAGHDQSGARLTTSQIRQNVESLLPVDVNNAQALNQVRQNRQGFYNGLLTQAGSAVRLPQYQGTLAADLEQAKASGGKTPSRYSEGQTATGPKGEKMTFTNGKWVRSGGR